MGNFLRAVQIFEENNVGHDIKWCLMKKSTFIKWSGIMQAYIQLGIDNTHR